MARETTLGKQFHTDDDELPWVYARTEDSGGIFGLEQDCLMTVMRTDLVSVAYAPHTYRLMSNLGIVTEPKPVEYVESYGDGTSHGATWGHFRDMVGALSTPKGFRRLDDRSIEHYLDGLLNMASEGDKRHGSGWSVIYEGLIDARNDLLEDLGWRQEQLYRGLGWLAANFAEREEASINIQAAELLS